MIKKSAFTLAEVLITLVIIGIIAAATIPTLLQKHQEQEMITRLRKAYSILSNAYAQAIRENGPVDEWDLGKYDKAESAIKLYEYFAPYLKVSKYCGNDSGCFAESYKTLTGKAWGTALDSHRTYAKVILDDGMSVIFWSAGSGGRSDTGTGLYEGQQFGSLEVDVNGKKGPNQAGVDLFYFRLKKEMVVPHGGPGYVANSTGNICEYNNTTSDKNGSACTAWVLYKGNMDYRRKAVSW